MIAFTIDRTDPEDDEALSTLYPRSFPKEDLMPLVTDLLALPSGIVSLAARTEGRLVGHALYTLGADDAGLPLALLGPLAVDPEVQRCGIGTALMTAGHAVLRELGVAGVLLLGDPRYYSRIGFVIADGIDGPYELTENYRRAWQFLNLTSETSAVPTGGLRLPDPWMVPEYWGR